MPHSVLTNFSQEGTFFHLSEIPWSHVTYRVIPCPFLKESWLVIFVDMFPDQCGTFTFLFSSCVIERLNQPNISGQNLAIQPSIKIKFKYFLKKSIFFLQLPTLHIVDIAIINLHSCNFLHCWNGNNLLLSSLMFLVKREIALGIFEKVFQSGCSEF